MKSQNMVICILLTGILFGVVGYDRGLVDAQVSTGPVKVGVVNVDMVLRSSKKHKAWQERMGAEEQKVKDELSAMADELKNLQEEMKTRTRGSDDYIKLMRQYAEKDGILKSRNDFYEQEVTMKVQYWTETVYKEILNQAEKVGKKHGLDMVFADEDVQIPAVSMRELLLGVRTNAVLYSNSKLNITNEVIVAVDGAL